MEYQAPERDAQFLLFDLFKVEEVWKDIPDFAELSEELINAVVAEGARLSAEVIAPSNEIGDQEGCVWEDGNVTTPEAFKSPFNELTAGGWLGLAGNPEFGGQGMPKMIACLLEEMLWARSNFFFFFFFFFAMTVWFV